MNGGSFSFANTAGAASYGETLPSVAINRGANSISSTQNTLGSSALTISTLLRSAGATLNFSGAGLGLSGQNQILIPSSTPLDDGLIGGWAVVDNDFAKHVAGSVTSLVAADYSTSTNTTTWTSADNIELTKGVTQLSPAGVTEINSLNFSGDVSPNPIAELDLTAGKTLRIGSGGIIVSGNYLGGRISRGTLTAGNGVDAAAELFFHINTANVAVNTFTVNSTIADNGTGAVSVVKSGIGILDLAASNTFTGSLTVNAGTLNLTGSASNTAGVVVNGGSLIVATTSGINPFGTAGIQLNGGTFGTVGNLLRTINNNITFGGDVTLAANSNGLIFSGTANLGSAQRTLTVTNTVTLSNVLSGSAGFIKAGAGSLVLTGTNDYTGQTAVTAGSLLISSDANLGAVPGSATAQSLFLNGGTLNTTATMTLSSNRGIYMGAFGRHVKRRSEHHADLRGRDRRRCVHEERAGNIGARRQ